MIHFVCGCDEERRVLNNGCPGNCSGNNIRYNKTLNRNEDRKYASHQYMNPPTNNDENVSDISTETT